VSVAGAVLQEDLLLFVVGGAGGGAEKEKMPVRNKDYDKTLDAGVCGRPARSSSSSSEQRQLCFSG